MAGILVAVLAYVRDDRPGARPTSPAPSTSTAPRPSPSDAPHVEADLRSDPYVGRVIGRAVTPRALVGVVVVLALVAGGAAWFVLRGGDVDCALSTQSRDDDVPAFVGRSGLVPTGSVGDERTPVVEAADALPAPFGKVVSGRFDGSEERVPQLVGDGDDVVLAVPPRTPGGPTTLQEVEPPEGETAWTRTYVGGQASGGPVGDLFVTAVGGSRPNAPQHRRGVR